MRTTLIIFGVVVLLRLVLAAVTPIVADETYYLAWATAPDWGYFDHPPAVAWLSATGLLSWGSPLAARLGTMLVAALAFPFSVGLLAQAGIRERSANLAGLLLLSFNLCALVAGVLTTPDVTLVTAWCAALHEAAAALSGRRRRWIGAGVAAGVGLLSKYTMVLIGPVFAWALWRGDRQALRTPWPWLAALLAGVVFTPHLVWNARHDWVPIRFALGHGFEGTRDVSAGLTTLLPPAEPPGQPERVIGRSFRPWVSGVLPEHPEDPQSWRARTVWYLGAVLAFWGALLLLVLQRAVRHLRRLPRPPDPVDPRVRPMLVAAMVVPVVFFGIANLAAQGEANWPAVYVLGAAPLLAGFCAGRLRTVVVLSAINAAAVLALAVYTRIPVGAGARNRVVREMQGFQELAARLGALHGPIFADRYQLVAELNFHAPQLDVRQWPGIRRPSEYLRRAEWTPDTVASLAAAGGLWLVTGNPMPPRLPGFHPAETFVAYYCLPQGLITADAFSTATFQAPCPGRSVYRWLVIRYRPPAAGD